MTAGEIIKELGQVAPDTEVKVSAGELLRIEAVRYMGYRDGVCTILTFDGGEE